MAAPGAFINPANPFKSIAGPTWAGGTSTRNIATIQNRQAGLNVPPMPGMLTLPGQGPVFPPPAPVQAQSRGGASAPAFGFTSSSSPAEAAMQRSVRIGNPGGVMSDPSPVAQAGQNFGMLDPEQFQIGATFAEREAAANDTHGFNMPHMAYGGGGTNMAVVGDPQKDGKPNPEIVMSASPIHVMPMKNDGRGMPHYAYGNNPPPAPLPDDLMRSGGALEVMPGSPYLTPGGNNFSTGGDSYARTPVSQSDQPPSSFSGSVDAPVDDSAARSAADYAWVMAHPSGNPTPYAIEPKARAGRDAAISSGLGNMLAEETPEYFQPVERLRPDQLAGSDAFMKDFESKHGKGAPVIYDNTRNTEPDHGYDTIHPEDSLSPPDPSSIMNGAVAPSGQPQVMGQPSAQMTPPPQPSAPVTPPPAPVQAPQNQANPQIAALQQQVNALQNKGPQTTESPLSILDIASGNRSGATKQELAAYDKLPGNTKVALARQWRTPAGLAMLQERHISEQYGRNKQAFEVQKHQDEVRHKEDILDETKRFHDLTQKHQERSDAERQRFHAVIENSKTFADKNKAWENLHKFEEEQRKGNDLVNTIQSRAEQYKDDKDAMIELNGIMKDEDPKTKEQALKTFDMRHPAKPQVVDLGQGRKVVSAPAGTEHALPPSPDEAQAKEEMKRHMDTIQHFETNFHNYDGTNDPAPEGSPKGTFGPIREAMLEDYKAARAALKGKASPAAPAKDATPATPATDAVSAALKSITGK